MTTDIKALCDQAFELSERYGDETISDREFITAASAVLPKIARACVEIEVRMRVLRDAAKENHKTALANHDSQAAVVWQNFLIATFPGEELDK